MITALVGIAALALLFIAFGLLRPRAGCGDACATCSHGCDLNKDESNV